MSFSCIPCLVCLYIIKCACSSIPRGPGYLCLPNSIYLPFTLHKSQCTICFFQKYDHDWKEKPSSTNFVYILHGWFRLRGLLFWDFSCPSNIIFWKLGWEQRVKWEDIFFQWWIIIWWPRAIHYVIVLIVESLLAKSHIGVNGNPIQRS